MFTEEFYYGNKTTRDGMATCGKENLYFTLESTKVGLSKTAGPQASLVISCHKVTAQVSVRKGASKQEDEEAMTQLSSAVTTQFPPLSV